MNSPSRYGFRCAGAEDAAQMNQVFSEQSFEGDIAVAYLRNPDPLASFRREGDELVMMILVDHKEQDKIIGIGGCIIRAGYIAGKACRIGYLTGLKLLSEYRGKIVCIPSLYEELHRLTKDKADAYYTTILSENVPVQKMFEKRRKRMPDYHYLGDCHTYFCKSGNTGFNRIPKGIEIKSCSGEEAALFYRQKCGKDNFAVADALQNDLKHADFYGLYREGTLEAAGYVLDQRAYKQYVVDHYGGIYRIISKLPTRLLGYPAFPKPGETANCAAAGIWCATQASNPIQAARLLFREMKKRSKQFDFLLICIHDNDKMMEAFRKEKKIDYKSRVYQVCWDLEIPIEENGRIQLEVGFL